MAKAKKGKLTIEDALVQVAEQPYAIPDNWCWTNQCIVAEFLNGRAYKQQELLDDGTTPILRVGNLFTNGNWYYSDLQLEEDKYIGNGDLIYAWSASFGPFIWDGERAIYHYHIWKLQLKSIVDKKYMYYWLLRDTEHLKSGSHGTGMVHLTKEMMEKNPMPLPPLEEQKRIVKQIENLFSKLDEAKEKVSDALDEFENRKGAIMHAAFSGKLTQEWREKNKISDDSWKHVAMGDIAKFHQGVQVPVDEQYDEDSEDRVRFIRIVDYTQGNEAPRYVSKDKATDDTYVFGNEIVMVRYGASAGFVGDNIEGVIANNMFTITVDEEIREYIKLYLRSPHMYKLLNTSGGSSAMPALNFKVVSKIELDIPSHDEIEQIYKVLNPVIEKYDKTEAIYINVIEQIELMKKAILAKAFRGELGTNIADEESSIEMLKRNLYSVETEGESE